MSLRSKHIAPCLKPNQTQGYFLLETRVWYSPPKLPDEGHTEGHIYRAAQRLTAASQTAHTIHIHQTARTVKADSGRCWGCQSQLYTVPWGRFVHESLRDCGEVTSTAQGTSSVRRHDEQTLRSSFVYRMRSWKQSKLKWTGNWSEYVVPYLQHVILEHKGGASCIPLDTSKTQDWGKQFKKTPSHCSSQALNNK